MPSRREMIFGTAGITAAIAADPVRALAQASPAPSPVTQVGRDVYFYQQPATALGCNQGWIVMDDYVIVIDSNFASQAQAMLPFLRATTDKPVRYVINTHAHGEHTYGNAFWISQGATPVAFAGIADDLRRLEPMQLGGSTAGRWEGTIPFAPELAHEKLRVPSLLVPSGTAFDDGTHRVEIVHPGWGHTRGDAAVWLPHERVLFVGDIAANGPFNVMLDANTASWIAALRRLEAYGPRVVGPGHGAAGDASLLAANRRFFERLVAEVTPMLGRSDDVVAIADAVRPKLLADPAIARFVLRGGEPFPPWLTLPAQVGHVRRERTGKAFAIPGAGGVTAFCCGSHGFDPAHATDLRHSARTPAGVPA